MKCYACETEYEGNQCPECGLQSIHIIGDYDEGIKEFLPLIEKHKEIYAKKHSFLSGQIGIQIYRRTNPEDPYSTAVPENIFFGNVEQLIKKEEWLNNNFVGFSDENKNIKICVVIEKDEIITKKYVDIPYEKESVYLQIGILVNDDNTFCLKLKDSRGIVGVSKKIPLNEE